MPAVEFAHERRFDDEADLRAAFASDRIRLSPGASLTVAGTVTLEGDVTVAGETVIGDGTMVDTGSILTDVRLGARNHVRPYSILTRLVAGDHNVFGPFCFVRDDCRVADHCILGAHVEAARSTFAAEVKVSHRAFVGDAEVGRGVIIGAGVVFCNYHDGRRSPTRVADGAMIGSGSLLVAPLIVGAGAILAAGSTVTRDVAAGARIIQRRDG